MALIATFSGVLRLANVFCNDSDSCAFELGYQLVRI